MTASRRLAPLPLLLIALAALAVFVLIPGDVVAQANNAATGLPRIVVSAESPGILAVDTWDIRDADGLPYGRLPHSDPELPAGGPADGRFIFAFSYQWIRVDGETEVDVGADSPRYQLVDADFGKKFKVRVSFTDRADNAEAVTSVPFGPIARPVSLPSPPTLVANTGFLLGLTTTMITSDYAIGFNLGDHGQGYEISSVLIDLAAVPSSLSVSLWTSGVPGSSGEDTRRAKLFEFENPDSFAVGLNEFTAPAGVYALHARKLWIVLSGFGSSLSIKEITSDSQNASSVSGASIDNDAGGDTNVLRLDIKGRVRTTGILAANLARPNTEGNQEIISVGDDVGWTIDLGQADRFLVRGVAFAMDDTTSADGGIDNPWNFRSDNFSGTRHFRLFLTRNVNGLPTWTAPQGATVPGDSTYAFEYAFGPDHSFTNDGATVERIGAVLSRTLHVDVAADGSSDAPTAAGTTLGKGEALSASDAAGPTPLMVVYGVPLHAMVQNPGQADNSYATATATNAVLSQGFTTGPNTDGYELQGIGVNIEGSGGNVPDDAASVSVAVHADLNGKPGAKLFDLLSPTEFAAGHSFFEAPAGTTLEASTSYALVWSHLGGTEHRLQRTLSDNEDSGALAGVSIANVFYRGADIDNLTANSTSNVLEIAVYGGLLPPSVTGVALTSAPVADNAYAIGDDVEATVTFSRAVDITGSPKLELDLAGTAKAAACATGTNTTTMVCSYTVAVGDSAPNGVAVAANKLSGGTITAQGTATAAVLTHSAVAIDAGHKVDGIRPTLVTTSPDEPKTSADGTKVILTFSEALSSADASRFTVQISTSGMHVTSAVTAATISGSRVAVTHSGVVSLTSTVGIIIKARAVTDLVGNDNLVITEPISVVNAFNVDPPEVSSVAMTSNPIDYGNTQNTYSTAEPIRATVTFSEAVDITGSPRLTMRIGSTDKHASCAAATNTTTMVCAYTVKQGDRDTDGLSINANSLSLNGGTIRKAGSSTINALLGHSGLGRLSSHKVDGSRQSSARSLSAITAYATETGDGTNTTMAFSVFLSRKASETVTVDYSTADGSAKAGEDYRATSGTLSFPPQTQVRTVDVTIYDDDIAEWTEYLVLVLSNPQGPAVILTRTPNADGRIYDETPAFHTYDESAYEGRSSTMRFYVSLNPEPDGETTVNYATRDVTARAGSDYTHTSGTLTFPVGVGRQTIDVEILDDNIDDSGETFQVVLNSPTGGASLRANRSIATGTILNTDPEEALSASFPTSAYASKSHSGADDRPQVVAAFSEAVASFTRDTPSVSVTNASVASVQAHTEDGLENAYIFFLTPNGDGDVTFTFEADSACASGGVCTRAGIPLTDVPTALTIPGPEETTQTSQLSVSDATASEEDDSTIDFVVTLSPASDETVSVNYATSDGTATAGDDYTAKNGSLTFNAGETSKTIQVSIIDDTVDDDNETLTVTLSNASGAEISDGQATGTITDGDTETSPLTAGFHDLPDSHDGSTAFTFRVLFSEDVGISYVNMRDDAFSLSEGDVTGARRVDGRNDLWEITVEPDDNSDVGITLPANRSCTTTGAICTREDSPRQLTNSPTATVTGPAEAPPTNTSAAGAPTISGTPQVEQTLTADTSSITDEDGLTNVSYSYQWIAGGSAISGATGSSYTLTASEQGKTVQVRVTFTDDADNEETLTSIATAEVTAAPVPLTVSVMVSAPATHDGSSEFTFEIEFSEEFGISYATLRDHAFDVTGGSVETAQRTDKPSNIAWLITVKPQGNGDVTIELPATTDCDADGAICTADGRKLSNSLSFTVSGPGG